MARIVGVDIPRQKRTVVALTYIYGIGPNVAAQKCKSVNISPDIRENDLADAEVARLRAYIDENLKVEGDLRRQVSQDINRKIDVGCYQGIRHRRGLPVRGQRTHTNARTRRGPRRAVAGKKSVMKKK